MGTFKKRSRIHASNCIGSKEFLGGTSINIVPGLEKLFALTAHFLPFFIKLYDIDVMSGMLSSYSECMCDVE